MDWKYENGRIYSVNESNELMAKPPLFTRKR